MVAHATVHKGDNAFSSRTLTSVSGGRANIDCVHSPTMIRVEYVFATLIELEQRDYKLADYLG